MSLDSKVWGPHYWFVFQTIGYNYPLKTNETIKKKYYDFIQNIPLLIPNKELANEFCKLLDKYPITPYLDNRESFLKWIYFMQNIILEKLGLEQYTVAESIENYYKNYEKLEIKVNNKKEIIQKYLYLLIILILIIISIFIYLKS